MKLPLLIFFGILLAFSGAHAVESATQPPGREVKFTQRLHEPDHVTALKDLGQQTQDDPKCAKCDDLTLGHASARALNFPFPDERDIDPNVKGWRSELAFKVKDNPGVVLSAREMQEITKCLGRMYRYYANGGDVIADALPMVDPKNSEAIEKAGADK